MNGRTYATATNSTPGLPPLGSSPFIIAKNISTHPPESRLTWLVSSRSSQGKPTTDEILIVKITPSCSGDSKWHDSVMNARSRTLAQASAAMGSAKHAW